ncbi:hypothetical protein J7J26_01590 [Candidatus Micrarchaeota archaeon]|nr:hypothetical protein [Candidatus Micrarchaeota archaeon]
MPNSKVDYKKAEELLSKYKEKIPETFKQNLDQLSWGTIANLLVEYQYKLEKESTNVKSIQKKLAVVLMILTDRLRKAGKGNIVFDAGFMRDLLKLLHELKSMSISYQVNLEEFMVLVALMLEKLKKEKLIVYSGNKYISSSRDLLSFRPEIESGVRLKRVSKKKSKKKK